MAPLYSWIINKIRIARYSVGNTPGLATRLYTFGGIYEGPYQNAKHDRTPLVFIMYCDNKYCHGINTNYLDRSELAWFGRNIYMIRKYQQAIDGRTFYNFLKQQKISIVKKAYRVYHTNLFNGKLVSAGITDMDKLCYNTRNPFINELNRKIAPSGLPTSPVNKVAYSSTELSDRIIEAQNSRPIQQQTIKPSVFGKAPWMK